MKRTMILAVLLGVAGGSIAGLAAEGNALGFGFGGGGVATFFPDLTGVNAFLSENGLAPLPDVLWGGCGGGRGGMIRGPSMGGMGFGVVAETANDDRSADLVVGAGGMDIGVAIGGGETSVLTVGAVLGGGAAVLDLMFPGVEPVVADSRGIVPEPLERTVGRAFAMALPYVSFEAQLTGFLGIEVRIGYLLPLFGFDFEDTVGIPAPSLDLSGPYVSASIAFGGIARAGEQPPAGEDGQAQESGTLELEAGAGLSIENGAGDLVISSYPYSSAQTDSRRRVEWSATYDEARPQGEPAVATSSGPGGATLRTMIDGQVDYVVRVPAGTSLEVKEGAGAIHMIGVAADSIRVTLGVGEMSLADIQAGSASLSVGVGEITFMASGTASLDARAGIGRMRIYLPPDASMAVSASVGVGEASVSGFLGMALSERRLLWTASTEATLGSGLGTCSLTAGIGQIEVRPIQPVGD